MNPYNYSLNVQSPIEAAVQGLKFGAMSADVQAAQQARELQMAQQQQAMDRQKMIQEAMTGLIGKVRDGKATVQDFGAFSLVAPKEQSEAAMKMWESMDKAQKENTLAFSTQVMSALGSKNPQIGIDLLKQKAEGERNSGREDQAKAYDTWAQLAELDPAGSQAVIGGMLQGLPGGEKALEGWVKVQGERRAQEMQPLEMEAKKRSGVPTAIQEAIDYGKMTPEQQKTFKDIQTLKKPPAAVTNVSVTNLEKSAAGELGKLLPDLYERANSSASQVSQIPRYREALSNAITGPFANQRLSAARISSALGFTGEKGINATREVIQGLSEMTLQSRSMLTGQGAISNTEQGLLERARGGDINFTKGELETIFNVAERASRAQYNKSVGLIKSAASKSETAQMYLQNITPLEQTPQKAQPATQQGMPAGWKVIR